MIQLIENIYGIEIPENAECFFLDKKHGLRFQIRSLMRRVKLPPGSYEAIGLGSEVKDETAAGIVECIDKHFGYYRYYDNDVVEGDKCTIRSPTDSLHSLIRSKGMEPETCFLIRKND